MKHVCTHHQIWLVIIWLVIQDNPRLLSSGLRVDLLTFAYKYITRVKGRLSVTSLWYWPVPHSDEEQACSAIDETSSGHVWEVQVHNMNSDRNLCK